MALALDAGRLRAANINPTTGLATDYLNHYNEVAMMVATLSELPEMREAILAWQPVGYATHFRTTGFRERDLAVAAYEAVPLDVKARFLHERLVLELAIRDVQDLIEAAPANAAVLSAHAPPIFAAIARLGAVINGGEVETCCAQSMADSLFS